MRTLQSKDSSPQRRVEGGHEGQRTTKSKPPKSNQKPTRGAVEDEPTNTPTSRLLASKQHDQRPMQSLADARRLPGEHDAMGLIKLWQEGTSSELEPGQAGIIAPLFRGCLDLLCALIRNSSSSSAVPRKAENALRRSLATLQLWADGHGVLDGKLDRLLDRSKNLQSTTLATINALCEILVIKLSKIVLAHSYEARLSLLRSTNAQVLYEQTKWILAGLDDTVNDNSSDTETSEDELVTNSIDSVVEDIKIYTRCLVDLNAALECPATDPDHDENEPGIHKLEQRSAYDYYADLIIAKYPKASLEVVQCLGKANWDRYQRMQMERHNNMNVATTKTLEQPISHAQKSLLAESKFPDSGLGTSIPGQSSNYAETIISFMSSISGGKPIKIPLLPAGAKNGEPFDCTACGAHIKITNNRAWRKHVLNDLKPYTCFHPECNFSAHPFPTFQLWSTHLELEHSLGPEWQSEQCLLCLEPTGSGKGAILVHFARHMEDIALAVLPRDIDSETNSNDQSETESKAQSVTSTSPVNTKLSPGFDSIVNVELEKEEDTDAWCIYCDQPHTTAYSFDGLDEHLANAHQTTKPAHSTFDTIFLHYTNWGQFGRLKYNLMDYISSEERTGVALQLYSSCRSLNPNSDVRVHVNQAVSLETKVFHLSQTKPTYLLKIKQKLQKLRQLRQLRSRNPQEPSIVLDTNKLDLATNKASFDIAEVRTEHSQSTKAPFTPSARTTTMATSHNSGIETEVLPLHSNEEKGMASGASLISKVGWRYLISDAKCRNELDPVYMAQYFKETLKSHQRPWKCMETTCRYFNLGWPTEHEHGKHVESNHEKGPPEWNCLYCTNYYFFEESNCRLHMEQAHGGKAYGATSYEQKDTTTISDPPPSTMEEVAKSSFASRTDPLPINTENPVKEDITQFNHVSYEFVKKEGKSVLRVSKPTARKMMRRKAVALDDIVPQNENELALVEGQEIVIQTRIGQGWLVAQDPNTGKRGLVPEGYVGLLREITPTGIAQQDELGRRDDDSDMGELSGPRLHSLKRVPPVAYPTESDDSDNDSELPKAPRKSNTRDVGRDNPGQIFARSDGILLDSDRQPTLKDHMAQPTALHQSSEYDFNQTWPPKNSLHPRCDIPESKAQSENGVLVYTNFEEYTNPTRSYDYSSPWPGEKTMGGDVLIEEVIETNTRTPGFRNSEYELDDSALPSPRGVEPTLLDFDMFTTTLPSPSSYVNELSGNFLYDPSKYENLDPRFEDSYTTYGNSYGSLNAHEQPSTYGPLVGTQQSFPSTVHAECRLPGYDLVPPTLQTSSTEAVASFSTSDTRDLLPSTTTTTQKAA